MPSVPGFIGGTYTNLSRLADCQESINLFPEPVESGTGRNQMVLHAAPGRRIWTTLPNTGIRAMFHRDGRAWAVAGDHLYELQVSGNAGTWVDRGAVMVDDNPAALDTNGTGGNQLFVVSGGAGYIQSLTTNTLTRIGGSFPVNASGAAFRDGYFFTLAGGFVYASNLEDGLTWSGASKSARNIASDQILTLIADDHRVIWIVGTETAEPWYDAAGSPFPLSPVPGAFMGMGANSAWGVQRFNNSIVLLGKNEHGDRMAVVAGAGYTAQRISNHALEAQWQRLSRADDVLVWAYQEGGHVFGTFTWPTANVSQTYDAAAQQWHTRGRWNTTKGQYDADPVSAHCFAFGKHLVGSRTTGVIYEQSMSLYDDAGGPKRWLRRSPHLAAGSDYIFIDEYELIGEVGQGLASGQGIDPKVMYRQSTDGGNTYGSERWVSLGPQGAYNTRVRWARCGRSFDRVIEISGSEPVKTTLVDLLFEGSAES